MTRRPRTRYETARGQVVANQRGSTGNREPKRTDSLMVAGYALVVSSVSLMQQQRVWSRIVREKERENSRLRKPRRVLRRVLERAGARVLIVIGYRRDLPARGNASCRANRQRRARIA